MATHSSVLAWRIPGTGEPGGLPSMGSHRVRHDWSDLAAAAAAVSNDVEHLFTCFLAMCLSSFQVTWPFFNQVALLLSPRFLYIFWILSDIWFANIFSHPVGFFFFHFLVVSFDVQKFLSLMNSNLFFSFVASVLVSCLRNHCQTQDYEDLSSRFLLRVLWSSLLFRFLIHFQLIFIYGII